MDDLLTKKVEKFTYCLNKNAPASEATEIIIVPTGADIAEGFGLAKELLSQKLSVRLIGEGVSLTSTHPAWARKAQRLWLTDLGAYHTRQLKKIDWDLQKEVTDWLSSILGKIIGGTDSSKVFRGSALWRFFSKNDNAASLPVLYTIVKLYGAKNYHYLSGSKIDSKQFEHIVTTFGGLLKTGKPDRDRAVRFRLLAQGFAMMSAVTLRETYYYMKEIPVRRKLKEHRRQTSHLAEPAVWAALFADNRRMNSLVIHSIILPALENKKPVGILLGGKLFLGETIKLESRERTGSENWTGLENIEKHLPECFIEQIVSAESIFELLKVHFRFWRKAGRAIIRTAMKPTYTGEKFKFNFSENLYELLKLLTQDIFSGLAAAEATSKVIARHNFKNAVVPFAISGGAAFSVTDILLQNAGATTLDLVHGINGIWLGMLASPSSVRQVRVKPNMETEFTPDQKITVTVQPQPTLIKRSRNHSKARNILITSNYSYYLSSYGGNIPWLPFQDELLSIVPIIKKHFPNRFEFRWRPHPVDWQTAVLKSAERVGGIELSLERPLNEDLEWADVVVSSFSGVLGDALWYDIPVFLHASPMSADVPATMCFAESRRFFFASEFIHPFTECVKRLDADDPDIMSFEKETRQKWFEITNEKAEA